jgi:hypothetical protein
LQKKPCCGFGSGTRAFFTLGSWIWNPGLKKSGSDNQDRNLPDHIPESLIRIFGGSESGIRCLFDLIEREISGSGINITHSQHWKKI